MKGVRFVLSDHFCLQVMTLNPVCENVETAQGVPLTVTGVAQVTHFHIVQCSLRFFRSTKGNEPL